MASTSDTVTYDSLLSATLNNVRPAIYDNISRDNVVWAWFHMNGRKTMENGGARIQRTVTRSLNDTVKSYSGYEVISIVPQDTETAALYDWKQIVGNVTISRIEERKNSGASQIFNLLRSKVENLQAAFADEMNRQFLGAFTARNGGKDIHSIPQIIPVATGSTLGGIDASAETYWEPQSTASSATTFAGLKKELRTMYNDCSKGPGGGPDLVIADQTTYETYEAAFDSLVRVQVGDQRLIDLGFDTVRVSGANMVWDERVPDAANSELSTVDGGSPTEGTAYFINSRFMEFVVDSQTDMINRPFMTAQDQDAKSALVMLYAQLITTNRRKQGVLNSISASITS